MSGSTKIPSPELIVVHSDAFDALIERNVVTVEEVFQEDPTRILVSVQIEEDQIDHLSRGLSGRSRRLIPLPVFVKLVAQLLPDAQKKA